MRRAIKNPVFEEPTEFTVPCCTCGQTTNDFLDLARERVAEIRNLPYQCGMCQFALPVVTA